MRKMLPKQAGIGLVGIVVVMGMVGLISVALVRTMTTAMQANKKNSNNLDLNAVKRTIIERMDCHNSITTLQTTCDTNELFRLQDKKGASLFALSADGQSNGTFEYEVGNWLVRANCDASTGGLKIGSELKTKDPLTGHTVVKENIFGQGSQFCENRFNLPPAGGGGGGGGAGTVVSNCSGTYDMQTGANTCCRMVEFKKYNGDGKGAHYGNPSLAIAKCNKNTEYMAWGGGRCQAKPDDDNQWSFTNTSWAKPAGGVLVHTTQPYFGSEPHPWGWAIDCQGGVTAVAYAACCPK